MLVGTGDVRIWLGISDGDKGPNAKIEQLSNSVQLFIEGECNRNFDAAMYKTDPMHSYYDGTGAAFLYLRDTPIWYVNAVAIDSGDNWASPSIVGTDEIIVYPGEGRIESMGDYFPRGRRNIRVEYYAGYGAGSYPVPSDLKQVIIEMVVQSMKEGITGIHTVAAQENTRIMQLLSGQSTWRKTIDRYRKYGFYAGYRSD
jgi:hypothetical protein